MYHCEEWQREIREVPKLCVLGCCRSEHAEHRLLPQRIAIPPPTRNATPPPTIRPNEQKNGDVRGKIERLVIIVWGHHHYYSS